SLSVIASPFSPGWTDLRRLCGTHAGWMRLGAEMPRCRMEIWTVGSSYATAAPRSATRAEAQGFDGILVVDSQNLAGDPFVGLALAARETSSVKLGTGVTNPATRHPAATAAAIASVHVASGGRAHLGIGRGDSALAHLGLAPASPA